MKEHKKLCKNSKKKSTLSRQKKKLRGVKGRIWEIFFEAKNEKIACKTQYRLARISILDSYDSSVVKSSDDAKKKFPPMRDLSVMGGKGKNIALSLKLSFSVAMDFNSEFST